MTEPDPIDFQAWRTPEPSPSLTRDILDRVGHASSAPERATPRLAMIAAAVVAAAAAALIVWKLRGGEPERVAPAIAVEERATEPDADEPRETRSTPLTPRLRRLVSADARARLLAAISTAHERQPAGSGGVLSLSRREIQAAMEELRPLLAECHEMALERTPGLAGTLKVKVTLVGEPRLATVVAEAEADPDDGLASDADFLECITETILSLELAAPAAGGTMSLTYPFVFRARSEDAGNRRGPTHRLPTPKPPAPAPAAPDPAPDIGSLTNEARAAARAGEWGRALKLAQQGLREDPTSQDALLLGVLAACKLQNADVARDYIGRLSSPTRQGMARQSCLKDGIEVGDD
jgi:hypothetical protein